MKYNERSGPIPILQVVGSFTCFPSSIITRALSTECFPRKHEDAFSTGSGAISDNSAAQVVVGQNQARRDE
ncbi:MAG: hypothetical protein AB8I40_04455 [Anaerolineales bacterium]